MIYASMKARFAAEAREDEENAKRFRLERLFSEAVQTDNVQQPIGFATGCKTVADLMADAIAIKPEFSDRLMQILANAASGRGTQRDAQQLLADIGAVWAGWEVE